MKTRLHSSGQEGCPWHALWVVLALAVTAAVWPALGGIWVYDDQILPDHPLLDGMDDLLSVWGRNSDNYLAQGNADSFVQHGVTYRPLPMATLILVNAMLGPSALAHHLVSLAIHLLTLLLLCRWAGAGGRVSWPGAVLLLIFALHPSLAEAYVWINGRSDAMAGAALVALALCLRMVSEPKRRALLSAPILLAGAFSKETFLIGSLALIIAWHDRITPPRGGARWRALVPTCLSWAVCAGIFLVARSATMAGSPGGVGLDPLLRTLRYAPRITALGAEALLTLEGGPMKLLSWEVSQPWSALQIAIGAALLPGACLLRQRPALILLTGAVVSLWPAGMLTNGFWLGFGRYLYQPACLLLMLPAMLREDRAGAHRWWIRGALAAAGGILSPLLFMVCWTTASAYRSHPGFCRAMVEARPADPTGYLLSAMDALQRGNDDLARRLMAALPAVDLPPAHAHRATRLWLQLGHAERASAVTQAALRRSPGDPRLLLDQLTLLGITGRWDDAVRLAAVIQGVHPDRRAAVRSLFEAWLRSGQVPAKWRSEVELLLQRAARRDSDGSLGAATSAPVGASGASPFVPSHPEPGPATGCEPAPPPRPSAAAAAGP